MNSELEPRFIQAAARIATDPTLRPFLEGLGELYFSEMNDLMEVSIDASPCKAAVFQGGATAFKHLIDICNKAASPSTQDSDPQQGQMIT